MKDNKPKLVIVRSEAEFKKMVAELGSEGITGTIKVTTGEGIDSLLNALQEAFNKDSKTETVTLTESQQMLLEKINENPLPFSVVGKLHLSVEQFTVLHALKSAGLVHLSAERNYVPTDKGQALIASPGSNTKEEIKGDTTLKGAEILMLVCANNRPIDLEDIEDDAEALEAQAKLEHLGLIHNCGRHIHITDAGRKVIKKLEAVVV